MQKPADLFKPADVPVEPAGLTGELLAELHDIVLRLGKVECHKDVQTKIPNLLNPRGLAIPIEAPRDVDVVRIFAPGPIELFLTVSGKVENRNMAVIGPGGHTVAGILIVPLAHVDGLSPAYVMWDRRLFPEEVRAMVPYLDPSLIESSSPKVSVAEIFASRFPRVPFQDGIDVGELVNQFDHPEEISVVTDELGQIFLVHRRNEQIFKRRAEVALDLLKREGLDSEDARMKASPLTLALLQNEMRETFQREGLIPA